MPLNNKSGLTKPVSDAMRERESDVLSGGERKGRDRGPGRGWASLRARAGLGPVKQARRGSVVVSRDWRQMPSRRAFSLLPSRPAPALNEEDTVEVGNPRDSVNWVLFNGRVGPAGRIFRSRSLPRDLGQLRVGDSVEQ